MTLTAYADCQPIYGGGTSCQPSSIVLTKSIFNPQTSTYVHDLGINDAQFQPGDVVTFQLSVTNTGTNTAGPIQVVDNFPHILNFIQGGETFNPATNSLNMSIPSLLPGKSQSFTFAAQVFPTSSFPSNQDTQCFTNSATATANDGTTSQDSSQFCIFHPLTASPAPTTVIPPSTGSSDLALLSLLPAAGFGLWITKLARKEHTYDA